MPSTLRRSYGATTLARSDASRREQCKLARAEMRRSPVWQQCIAALLPFCLLQGHTRPLGKTAAWLLQDFLVPGDPASSQAARAHDVATNLADAFKMEHPRQHMDAKLDPACKAAIEWQCGVRLNGDDLRSFRNERLSAVHQCARSLEGWTRELEQAAPPWLAGSRLPRPHHALFDLLVEACGLPDTNLVEDLVCGAPAVGICPDSGVFRRDWQPSSVCMDDLDHAAWHADVHRKLSSAGSDPSRRAEHMALWLRTAEEVSKGYATRLGSLADASAFFGGAQNFREMVRFAVAISCSSSSTVHPRISA